MRARVKCAFVIAIFREKGRWLFLCACYRVWESRQRVICQMYAAIYFMPGAAVESAGQTAGSAWVVMNRHFGMALMYQAKNGFCLSLARRILDAGRRKS